MKKLIISMIGCVAAACIIAGCAHTSNSTARTDAQSPITISIAQDGALSVAGEQCDPDQLSARLTELGAKKAGIVKIEADKESSYKQVVEVIDACRAAGVHRVVNVASAR